MNEPLTLIEMHMVKHAGFYETGVLKPEPHYRLVENIDEYARDAGIRVGDICVPFKNCNPTDPERVYVELLVKTGAKTVETLGMYYEKEMDPTIHDRSRVIAAAMLRYFIATKVINQRRFFDLIVEGEDFNDYTVLILPDIFRNIAGLSEGLRRSTSSILMERYSEGKHTIVGRITSMKEVANKFGDDVSGMIEQHFMGA